MPGEHRITGRLAIAAALLAAACPPAFCERAAAPPALTWSELPQLPPAPGETKQIGLAGPFAGVHDDALIVAGGANFPDALPWRGGKKVWWDDAFVLVRDGGGYQWITDPRFKLPRPLAYGAAVSTPDGVVCIGGCDASQCYADVFRLQWVPDRKRLTASELPSLPRPLAFMSAAMVGDVIYVAGGQETMADARATKSFLALDLAAKDDPKAFRWRELEPWAGSARILPVVAAQSDGTTNCLYLFSGRDVAPGMPASLLTDAYRYDPLTGRWRKLADVAPPGESPRCVMAAAGCASGANHILIFGGDDGKLFRRLEDLDRRGETAEASGIRDNHPGFSRDVLAYHTVTDTYVKAGELPTGSHVTTAAVPWRGSFVIPSGEISPGIRSPRVWKGDRPPARPFGWVNYSVLGVYLASLVAMGVYFSRREKSTEDFFKAGRRVPWWAAGLSIFGTQLSAITFMAIPAKTFAADWRRFMGNVCILVVAPFIIAVILPFFRRLDVTTAYEYLEKRFNVAARLIGSVMFVLFQFGRIGIVLFLPSIALSVVTGIDVRACILVMGALSIAYTVLGGIEAVIWTDVLQVIVLLGGAVFCLVLILVDLPGGAAGLIDLAAGAGKLKAFDFRFDFTTETFWVVVLGGLAAGFISYGSDQAVIQRYLTTKDEKAAARSIWTNGILCIPASVLFFGVGTALYAYYGSYPQQLSATLDNADAIFPWYIVTQLPAGVAGILIAGVFAAAMSSLDSSMNSVATAVTTDFYRRFRPGAPDRACLRLARVV
ncbi:MAG: sodium/solute symporter, partial [Phycisphaerae bacterium]